MKTAHGLRAYFYEYLYYTAVTRARDQTGQVVPISQAKSIRARVDEILSGQGSALTDPRLGVTACLTAIDQALGERVSGYEPQFGDHTPRDARYQRLQREFTRSPESAPTPSPPRPGCRSAPMPRTGRAARR